MKIIDCKRIEFLSWYNNNIYELPYEILGCTHIRSSHCDCNGFLGYTIGRLENKNYKIYLYLHADEDSELVDYEKISVISRWT